MKRIENILFSARKISLLIIALEFRFSLTLFFIVFIADFILEIINAFIKMLFASPGYEEAAQNNVNYKDDLLFDYLRFNGYFLVLIIFPFIFSTSVFGALNDSTDIKSIGEILKDSSVLLSLGVSALFQLVECFVCIISKDRPCLEAVAHFDFVRIFIFTFLLYLNGPLSWWFYINPAVGFPLAFSVLSFFEIMNKLFSNREPEYMTD